jgi:cytochrome c oxidase subunit 2
LDPAGPAAEAIALLWWTMLLGAATIFLATSLVLVGAYAPSVRTKLTPKLLITWGGLVIPSALLTALVITAFALGEQLLPTAERSASRQIEVIARRFAWEFRYPGVAGSTQDVLHIPAGRDMHLIVTSEDVIHSFWIPRLGGKIDAIPGHPNVVRLKAEKPGSYGGICAEFCGDGHTIMRFQVVAHAAEDYDAALARAAETGR